MALVRLSHTQSFLVTVGGNGKYEPPLFLDATRRLISLSGHAYEQNLWALVSPPYRAHDI